MNNDKILKYNYRIFSQLRGQLAVILEFLKESPDIDRLSCFQKAQDTCDELMKLFDILNMKEMIKLKIKLKEATIQTNLGEYKKAAEILEFT